MNKEAPPEQATMADWLALHELTPDLCKALLDAAPRPVNPGRQEGDAVVTLSSDQAWKYCADVFCAALPAAAETIAVLLTEVRTDFSKQIAQSKRAFTLHDDGYGRPLVFCPWAGTQRNLLTMAHEFGHALQLVASKERDMAPVCRETTAFIGEHWAAGGTLLGSQLHALGEQRTERLMKRGATLEAALWDPQTPYRYEWNYPPARALSVLLTARADDAAIWALFRGALSLPQLLEIVGIQNSDAP